MVLTEEALKWFDSYLQPRYFKVVIDNGHYSKEHNLEVSIPQGSCAGVNIFKSVTVPPLQDVVPNDLHLSGFVDDHAVSERNSKQEMPHKEINTKCSVKSCMLNIKCWHGHSACLKMNPAKTEFIYFSSRPQLKKCLVDDFNVAGDLIVRSHSIKYLGAHLDEHLNFKLHVTKKCQAATFNYFKIWIIRHLLNSETTARLCLSLCISHLDYCNAMLYGLPDTTINKLQRVQNMCACLTLRRSKRDSIKKCLRELHWLPIQQCIAYKILVLTQKSVNKQGPKYLQGTLNTSANKKTRLKIIRN